MNSSENTLRMSLGRVRTPGRDFLPLSGVGEGLAVNLMPTYVQQCVSIMWGSSGEWDVPETQPHHQGTRDRLLLRPPPLPTS